MRRPPAIPVRCRRRPLRKRIDSPFIQVDLIAIGTIELEAGVKMLPVKTHRIGIFEFGILSVKDLPVIGVHFPVVVDIRIPDVARCRSSAQGRLVGSGIYFLLALEDTGHLIPLEGIYRVSICVYALPSGDGIFWRTQD